MKNIRLVHFYLGVFFAPLILFFAFSGTLQVFKLHETCRETASCLSDWVAWFSQFHKEQAWIPPKAGPGKSAAPAPRPPSGEKHASLAMKWLIAAMGIALMISTCLGLYIAFKYPSRRKGFAIALAAGVVIPLALMAT